MPQVPHKVIDDEPEGGWLSPAGPNGWPDLEELNKRQLQPVHDRLAGRAKLTRAEQATLEYCRQSGCGCQS